MWRFVASPFALIGSSFLSLSCVTMDLQIAVMSSICSCFEGTVVWIWSIMWMDLHVAATSSICSCRGGLSMCVEALADFVDLFTCLLFCFHVG